MSQWHEQKQAHKHRLVLEIIFDLSALHAPLKYRLYNTGGCLERGQNWPQKTGHVRGIYLILATFEASSLKINTLENLATFEASRLNTNNLDHISGITAEMVTQNNSEKLNFENFIEFSWRS